MKYELKRKTSQHILLDIGIIIISIIGLVLTEGESIVCVFVGLMASGFLVNEIMRSKDPKFTFDENGFYIGETRYSYKQIEKITTRRDRYVTNMKLIVDGEVVYKFDTSYENANEFIKRLTLSGVEHNLFGR
jgi:uncharacterized membrane protein YobD (UPF0266 family)